jgi:anaerobic magnesium-protoporphyrin IX monomethyl ester cyclase
MRVLLVGPDYEANLSLLYLASSLRAAGHCPVIAPFNTAADAPAVIAQARAADLVGLSMCFQVRATEFLDLADALKREDPARPIVAGGHYASCAAADLLTHHAALDVIAVHEGEQTIVELAGLGDELLARAAGVPGGVVRRDGRPWFSPPRPIFAELDRLPRPDRSGPARLLCGVPTAYLMGSRGCVSACDYCCITTLHRMATGRRFRQRTPEDVAGEMADLYDFHGVRQFVFHDDNFLVPSYEHNRQRIGRIDAVLRARGVRDIGLVLKCSPRDADRRILETLRAMGLLRIFMGIESGSECGLASIGRRQTVEQSERALEICEQLGISSQYTMIIFSPEATVASMLADLDFIDRHPGHPLNYCRAEVYAGTPLEARMLREGRALGSYLGRVYRYTDPKVELVWEKGKDLFAGRCWGNDELLGKVIRMDHQVAVLDHFYGGRRVRELVRSFLEWERELNLETSGLFRELVLACGNASSADDPALDAAIADVRRREAPSRQERLTQACEFRKALDRFSQSSVESGRRYARALAEGRKMRPHRHAAAVAVAIGLVGCTPPRQDWGVAEAAPPPYGDRFTAPPPPEPEDAGTLEAEPPPHDEPIPKPPSPPPAVDAGTPAIAPKPPQYIPDRGVAEAAPPPIDKRYRLDHGVAEAAPPPVKPIPFPHVVTTPPVPMSSRGVQLEPSSRWMIQPGVPLELGDATAPKLGIAVTLAPVSVTSSKLVLDLRSATPLKVRFGAVEATTPTRIVVDLTQSSPPLLLEDPENRTRLQVRFVR